MQLTKEEHMNAASKPAKKAKMTAAEYLAHVNRQLALVGAEPVTAEGIAQRYGAEAGKRVAAVLSC
jgi:hypothetical protein